MVLPESVDKGRLSRWAFIVLLLFAVALVLQTHINTSMSQNDAETPSAKILTRPRAIAADTINADTNDASDSGIAAMMGSFASKVVEEASMDVASVMNMFKPSGDLSTPTPLEKEILGTPVSTPPVTSLQPQQLSPAPQSSSPHQTVNAVPTNAIPRDPSVGRISFRHKETPPATATPAKVQSPAKQTSDQPISFLDPAVHGHQTKSAPAVKPGPKPSPRKDDGHISFLDSNSAELQKQLKPAKQKKPPTQKRAQQQDEDLARIQAENNHPRISPRPGTDISTENQMSLLLCPNQAKCIVPELQLQTKLKVYFCKHPTRHGVRFYYLAREGLMLHPNVELVPESAIETADFIIYLPGSAPWHLTEIKNASFAKRLIVLDEFDGHTLFSPGYPQAEHVERYGGPSAPWYYMYFKRSYVRRLDGRFQGYPHLVQHELYPLTYSIAEVYIPQHFNAKREIEILCTLRGSKSMTTRLRVQTWVSEYGKERKVQNIITGEVNTATRTTVSKQYFEQMFNAQIIVTVNPANWEGDFRLWESMCTGALIFVDPVFVPHPFPLQDKVHVVFFSNSDREDLFRKLDYYRAHPQEARKIAAQGYLHAMKHHRTVSMIDYILRTAHLRRVALTENNPQRLPNYTYTGQYLHYEAQVQEKHIKACHQPGIYQPPAHPNDPVVRLTADCRGAGGATLQLSLNKQAPVEANNGQIQFLH